MTRLSAFRLPSDAPREAVAPGVTARAAGGAARRSRHAPAVARAGGGQTGHAARAATGGGQTGHAVPAAMNGGRAGMRQFAALVGKDLVAEWRGREMLTSTAVFALLVLVVFTFAFDLRAENVGLVAPGALWVAFAFAATLGLGRSMAQEVERGTLEGLLLCPTDPSTIYLAKLTSNLLFTGALEVAVLPIFAAMFDVPVLQPGVLVVVILGTVGFVAAGTLFAAVAAGTRAREILLPVLLFPVSVPVMIAAVKGTAAVLDASAGGMASLATAAPWLKLLAGYDELFVVIGWLAFQYVVEE
jgi:heme exporter protein B